MQRGSVFWTIFGKCMAFAILVAGAAGIALNSHDVFTVTILLAGLIGIVWGVYADRVKMSGEFEYDPYK